MTLDECTDEDIRTQVNGIDFIIDRALYMTAGEEFSISLDSTKNLRVESETLKKQSSGGRLS